jgi:hypothetical protein
MPSRSDAPRRRSAPDLVGFVAHTAFAGREIGPGEKSAAEAAPK